MSSRPSFRERHLARRPQARQPPPRRPRSGLFWVTVALLTVYGLLFVYGRLAEQRLPDFSGSEAARFALPGSEALTDRVVEVVDGDTIRTARYGRVRYIGINTPELSADDPDVRRMAERARQTNERLVGGREVRLALDVQSHDRYGRLLAYVWVDRIFVNAWLVEQGYAQVMTVPPNVRYAERLRDLERKARREGRGLWREAKFQSL